MTEQSSTELELMPTTTRTVDMRSTATDSWTDVLPDVINLSRGIATTEFVPAGLRGSMEKVTAAILYSRELGLPPMTGLGSTHVIDGKAGISAELMRALILQAGHELQIVEATAKQCVMRGRRKGSEEWTQAQFTIVEAQSIKFRTKQGWQPLTTKANWQNFPADMLLARCTTRLARMIFPDVVHGMRSSEELADQTELVDQEQGQGEPQKATTKVARKRSTNRPIEGTAGDRAEGQQAVGTVPVPPPPAPAEQPAEPATEQELGDELRRQVERTRVARQQAAEQTAQAEPQPDEDGVVDADVVEEQPDEPAPLAEEESPKQAGPRLLAVLRQQFDRLGVTEREERIWWTGQLAGRDVLTSKDLADGEARDLVKQLERLRDRAALEATKGGEQ